jgi:hypothetical protein
MQRKYSKGIKFKKNAIIAGLASILILQTSVFAADGDKAVLVNVDNSVQSEIKGWGLGIGNFEKDFGVHARKDFMFGEEQKFEAVIQAGIYNQKKWTGRFDIDFHYVFKPASSTLLYPLVGVDYAVQKRDNRFGMNLGGGCMFDLNEITRLFVEAKYVTGDWDGYSISIGIYF